MIPIMTASLWILQRRYDEQYELIEDMETQLAEIQGQIDDIHQGEDHS